MYIKTYNIRDSKISWHEITQHSSACRLNQSINLTSWMFRFYITNKLIITSYKVLKNKRYLDLA